MNTVLVFGNVTHNYVIVTIESLRSPTRHVYASSHTIGYKAFGRKLRSHNGDLVTTLKHFAKGQSLTNMQVSAVFFDNIVQEVLKHLDIEQQVKEAFPQATCHLVPIYASTR